MRHVTLTEEASAFVASLVAGRAPQDPLLRRDDGRAWKRAEQVRLMRQACARAGIVPAVGFHVLRHTHGSLLAMRAVPMAVIARQLGHADTRMTEKHYAHLAPNYVADTIREGFPRLEAKSRSSLQSSCGAGPRRPGAEPQLSDKMLQRLLFSDRKISRYQQEYQHGIERVSCPASMFPFAQ